MREIWDETGRDGTITTKRVEVGLDALESRLQLLSAFLAFLPREDSILRDRRK